VIASSEVTPVLDNPPVVGSLTGTGVGSTFQPGSSGQPFNVFIYGTFSATVTVVRSFDQGATWQTVLKPDVATAATFTAAANFAAFEPNADVLWAINCTAYTSGKIQYRIG
jgi:hypothetical protein